MARGGIVIALVAAIFGALLFARAAQSFSDQLSRYRPSTGETELSLRQEGVEGRRKNILDRGGGANLATAFRHALVTIALHDKEPSNR